MLQKIRIAMAHQEERYQLAGLVELDEMIYLHKPASANREAVW